MKTVYFLIFISLLCCVAAQAETLAEWNFDGIDNVSDDTEPPYPANITLNASITNATIYHSLPAAALRDTSDAYKAIDWEDATDVAASITRGNYFTIQFNADAGMVMNLTNFTVLVDEMVGADKVAGYAITSGVLGHDVANILATGTLADTDQPEVVSLDLSGGTYNNLSEIEFRIYGWSAGGTALANYDGISIGQADKTDAVADVQLSGTVSSSAQIGTLFVIK